MNNFNDNKIKQMERELEELRKSQENSIHLFETDIFNREVEIAKNFEKSDEQNISFLERLSIISGVIAPFSLMLITLDFVYKPFILASFFLFLINIFLIQVYVYKFLINKTKKNLDKFFELFDYSQSVTDYKLSRSGNERLNKYNNILTEEHKIRISETNFYNYGKTREYIKFILVILAFAILLLILSVSMNYIQDTYSTLFSKK